MLSFPKRLLRVITGGRRNTIEQEFEQALKNNASTLVEMMKERLAASPELKAEQARLYGKQARLGHTYCLQEALTRGVRWTIV